MSAVASIIRSHLSRYVGPFTAKNALELSAKQAWGKPGDQLNAAEVSRVLEGLGPMLRTLLGKPTTEKLMTEIRQELSGE